MMQHIIKGVILGSCILNLTSCMVQDEANYSASYQTISYNSSPYYPMSDYSTSDAGYRYQTGSTEVTVPDSYHVGAFHSPTSFKDRDKTWVSGQNPQGYTIALAEGEKAAQVAKTLYKTPKTDRTAQVKLQQNGKAYYKGLYGSYPDAASAQKALDALPDDVKKGAAVTTWGSIQGGVE